jgi:putative MATE family efflux protein
MFRLAVPGVIGAFLTSTPGLFEATFLKASGADALAAVALVYPIVILAGMFSAGAFGGAVSGFTARAIGAGNYDEASTILTCAVLISLVGGIIMWALVVLLGPFLYQYATDSIVVSEAAQHYAMLLFPVIPAYWLINMLSSVLRGSGDMIRPAVIAASLLATYILLAVFMIPNREGDLDVAIKAAALAMAGAYILAALMTIYFIGQAKQPIPFYMSAFKSDTLVQILKQGLLAASQSIMTIIYALTTTLIFSRFGTDWLAGFGLAVRLELIMVPVIFGIGASMIAIIGAYVGAGQRQQAISIAWRGIGVNVALIGLLGLFLSIFPQSWCSIVGSDPSVIANCSQSLRIIAPTYAFFALGLSCYLASQALNTLNFPVIGALLRLLVAATGLYWISQTTPINNALYLVAAAAVIYGIVVAVGLRFGPWRRQ